MSLVLSDELDMSQYTSHEHHHKDTVLGYKTIYEDDYPIGKVRVLSNYINDMGGLTNRPTKTPILVLLPFTTDIPERMNELIETFTVGKLDVALACEVTEMDSLPTNWGRHFLTSPAASFQDIWTDCSLLFYKRQLKLKPLAAAIASALRGG